VALSDIVRVTVTTESAKVLRAGFGVPLILSCNATWLDLVRFYTSADGLLADGFTTDMPEYKMASAIFAQTPAPARVAVGKRGNKPTQRFKVTVSLVANATAYKLEVNGEEVTFTSDANATNDEIIAGLVTAFNLETSTLTASAQGVVGSQHMQLLGDSAGSWDDVEILDVEKGLLAIAQDNDDNSVDTDLAAIKVFDGTWYAVLNPWNSKDSIEEIAAWVETNKKLFIAQTCDTEVITVADSIATDVAKTLKTATYFRTALIYHPKVAAFADAAWGGKMLPEDPGSETWKFKTLAGVPAVKFTETHLVNLQAKYCNWYETVAGVNITQEGKVSGNEWIDVIRFRDWLEARIGERIFGRLTTSKKVPFTDHGVTTIVGDVTAQLAEGIRVGGLAKDPEPTVTAPKVADISVLDRANRHLPDVEFSARLAGAIHTLDISGVVSP
jgi:hypothetical protein